MAEVVDPEETVGPNDRCPHEIFAPMVGVHVGFALLCALWAFPDGDFKWVPLIGRYTEGLAAKREQILEAYPGLGNRKLAFYAVLFCAFGAFTCMEAQRFGFVRYYCVFVVSTGIHLLNVLVLYYYAYTGKRIAIKGE